jgi:nitrite reductase/ring-hydroxylating ferredoxin subunit
MDKTVAPEIEVERFTQPERLEQSLKRLHAGAVISKGEYSSDIPGYINDMEWNFYDEIHRIYVHDTYHEMQKIFSGKTFSVNLVKWRNWPVFIQVANAKVAPNLFYQTMCIFGIFYIHQIMELEQRNREIRLTRKWLTMSHWLFRFLHGPINRQLMKLQVKQDQEDNSLIRHRRLALRDAGYHFLTDTATFTTANQLTNNVYFPQSPPLAVWKLSGVSAQEKQSITVGILELLIVREGEGLRVWPGICPHEGAAMTAEHLCEGVIHCPWHGRKFNGNLLVVGGESWQFMDFEVALEPDQLVVRRVKQPSQAKVA